MPRPRKIVNPALELTMCTNGVTEFQFPRRNFEAKTTIKTDEWIASAARNRLVCQREREGKEKKKKSFEERTKERERERYVSN